jgi:hypothetical protein
MMDCDGDRRDFAKKQWREFLDKAEKKAAGKEGTE